MNTVQNQHRVVAGLQLTKEERDALGITPFLPRQVLDLEQEMTTILSRMREMPTDFAKYLFLRGLRERNKALFYHLISAHIEELLPIVYTPTISEPIQRFSQCYDGTSGVYFSIDQMAELPRLMEQVKAKYPRIDIVIVTDGEGILGIGDWGVGGSEIVAGKGVVYTVAAHIPAERILTVMLDVGTNNPELLADPYYLGLRQKRAIGAEYDAFIAAFITELNHSYPQALLHWEDFGRENADRLLQKYADSFTFNDDIQGTGIIVLAALSAALKRVQADLFAQKIFIFGAGSAGRGIAAQIKDWLVTQGLTMQEADQCFYFFGKEGLISKQKELAGLPLAEAVNQIHPTVLVGTSTSPGAFTREIVTSMAQSCETPIIFPISNPTALAEATPQDLLDWTQSRVFVATGSPFEDVMIGGKRHRVAQANNALAYPGLALGAILGNATRINAKMLSVAAEAIGAFETSDDALLPAIPELHAVSMTVAKAVAEYSLGETWSNSVFEEKLYTYLN
ncbi:oxaloacetate-decarboxylating malate dehydrogenase [Listeria grandensis]|uniref:oxaloacetate-decarboxylating malate dehydrogenase n=1 Tax=Listeria grandensis TaxID=1494963 RepID=UPI00164D8704|nr:oxaloacetate-decarboxylating malate dehydrogenase [Listeria grandensis]